MQDRKVSLFGENRATFTGAPLRTPTVGQWQRRRLPDQAIIARKLLPPLRLDRVHTRMCTGSTLRVVDLLASVALTFTACDGENDLTDQANASAS